MKDKLKKYIPFLIPMVIILIALLANRIYPFGSKILPLLDGYQQYPGFLSSFKEIILGKETILYSFKGVTGFNLFAACVYYNFNITNLLFLLFKTKHIIDFYTFIIIIKICLCSWTMHTYLNYLGKKKYNYLFSICYALSSYNLLYYLNYMWFDSVILLPLVMLGLEKIFKENKYYYYVITLTLAILSNFYIGYMICIFSVIYFIYKCILTKSKDKIFKFLLYSLLSGLITSFALIPVIIELINGKGSIFSEMEYFKMDLDGISALYKLTIGSYSNGDLEYGSPNVYVTLFIYLNAIMYFFNNKIKLKEKITSGIIILFFLLSMSFNLLDYFWQMMQMPIFYPVRYAFIFDFYLIYLAYQNYNNYEKLSIIKILIIALIIFIFSTLGFITAGNLLDKVNLPAKLIYFGITVLFITYYLFIQNSKAFSKYIYIIVLVELSVNTFVTLRNTGITNTYEEFSSSYQMNNEIIKKLDLDYFNRLTFEEKTIKNNGLLHSYNELNYFSSVRNNKTFNTLNKVFGIITIDNCNIKYFYNNPLVNSLLGIRYFITKDDLNIYELKDTYNDYNIYENKDIAPLGFAISKMDKFVIEDDYLTNINKLVKLINNDNIDILKEVPVKDTNISCSKISNICINNGTPYMYYEYTAKKDEIMYIQNDFPSGKDDSIYKLTINGKEIIFNNNYPLKIKKNDHITLNITPWERFKDYYYHFYIIDEKEYNNLIKNVNKEKLVIKNYKNDANFTTEIELENDGTLLTTISNDKGWKILVDGKDVQDANLFEGFITLDLTKGKHTIEFKFTPPGLKIGIIISSISLLGTVILLRKSQK